MTRLKVKRLKPEAKLPTRAHANDAGLDLYLPKSSRVFLRVEDMEMIETGIAVFIPKGYVGLIKGRSSLAAKGLQILGGVIDSGYTGEIRIVMLNSTCDIVNLKGGDKIAQLLIIPIETPEVEEVDTFVVTERGVNGFGSTGRS